MEQRGGRDGGFAYSGGVLSTVTSATGRHLTLNYSGSQISSVTDGSRTVSYGYTGGNLSRFTDALNQNTTYAYDTSGTQDTAGHLTQVFYPSNPGNAFVTNFYDSLGRVSQQKDANGKVSLAYFAGSRTEIGDPAGNRHVWYNDPLGNVTADIQDYGLSPHLNLTTANIYDAQRNLVSATMPEGDSIQYTYDSLFNPLTVSHVAKPGSGLTAQTQTYGYTVPVASLPNFEEVHTAQDAKGNVTSYTYNSTGGTLYKIDQPAVPKPGAGTSAPEQVFTWTALGLPQTAQDAEGRVTRYDYDPTYGDEVNKVTADYGTGRLNLITQYGYDAYGDANSVTDANGKTTTSVFDALRRVTEADAPIAGVKTTWTYFPDGPVHTVTRNSGTPEMTTYSYTVSDKVSSVADALGNTTTTTYDPDDRVQTVTQQVTAAQNRQRTSSYDALSRIYQVSDTTAGSPGTVLETHAYTKNGRELSFTDANGNAITWTYDGLDRLSQTTYPDHSTVSSQFDANGNVTQATTRSAQTIGFTYDALNRVATKNPLGEVAGVVSYGYDLTGRLLQALDGSSGNPYAIGYDTAGRANSFTDQQGRNVAVAYDGAGNRTRLQWPANTYGSSAYFVTYAYDAMNRPTEIDENGSASNALAKYQWDALSRLSLITYGDGSTDAYSQYDAGDNLLTLSQSFAGGQNSVTFSYSWLKNHQRQSTGVSNGAFQYIPFTGTVSYGAANANNGYPSVGGVSLTYDANGNLGSDGFNTQLMYDVENRLTQAQNGAHGTSQYLYDPLGHRKQKVTGGVTTQFVLAGDEEIADFTGTGVGTAQMLTVRGVGGLPVAEVTPGSPESVVYYHHAVLGSTVAETTPGQNGAEAFTYGEFGAPGAGYAFTYGFAGYRYDTETGLYYVRARYYSPGLGRFLQTDPIGIAGGANLYGYVGNDPINLTDPSGWQSGPASGFTLSDSGLKFIENHEGHSLTVYNDSAGYPTIGYGHKLTGAESYPNGITQVQAENLLQGDAGTAVSAVQNRVTVDINQNQFDALVSFTFNTGTGALATSTLLRSLNAGDYTAAADQFLVWDKARVNGQLTVNQGLLNRRTDEENLFNTAPSGPTTAGIDSFGQTNIDSMK